MGKSKESNPKGYNLRVSENASQNINDIIEYITYINFQPQNAINVGDEIFSSIERIKLNPFAFRECEEIPTKTKMYRKAVCMSWDIIYKISNNEILILGIIHSSRSDSNKRNLRKIK